MGNFTNRRDIADGEQGIRRRLDPDDFGLGSHGRLDGCEVAHVDITGSDAEVRKNLTH